MDPAPRGITLRKLPQGDQFDFIRGLLVTNVMAIVEHQDQVTVWWKAIGDHHVAFTVRVRYSDMGLVLGEGGATADAIRRVIWVACKKTDLRADIEFEA